MISRPSLLLLLLSAAACDRATDSRTVAPDGGAPDGLPDVAPDLPPDTNPLGSAKPCDPFVPGDPSITRPSGTLGIGRHRDGTVYVIDKPWIDERVFSSEGAGRVYFQRKVSTEVIGAGGGVVFAATGPGQPFLLKLEFVNPPTPRMGVLRGQAQARDFVIGSEGDELEIPGDNSAPLAGMEFRALPSAATAIYFGEMEDGRRLAVFKLDSEIDSVGFRLFLGLATAMVERPIQYIRAGEGNRSWVITFILDAARVEVTFPVKGGPGSLKTDARTFSLTQLAPDLAKGGHVYGCI